jgi:hypothetical protein
MNTDKWQYELSSNGFFVLRNCISPELLQEAKAIMAAALCRLLRKNVGLNEGILEASEIHHQADVQYLLHQELQAQKIKRRFLLHPPLLDVFIRLLGPDLAFNRDGAVAINIKPTEDNLYSKSFHQEIWSGAGVMELRIWLPLSMHKSAGGMSFIKESHRWGLIANRKRMPYDVPAEADMTPFVPEVQEGDAVIFHSMTLHATEPNNAGDPPRVAITTGVRNLYHRPSGHEFLQSWQPYHLSPMGHIQKALGNPWLSSYRTLGAPLSHRKEGDGKKEVLGTLD